MFLDFAEGRQIITDRVAQIPTSFLETSMKAHESSFAPTAFGNQLECPAAEADGRNLSDHYSRLDLPAITGFALTFAKMPMAMLIFISMATGRLDLTALLILVSIPLDIFDGKVFGWSSMAKNRCLSSYRRISDSVLDRLVIQSALLPALVWFGLPPSIYVLFTLKELIVSGICGYALLHNGDLMRPNNLSRAATVLMGTYMILFCLGVFVTPILVMLFVMLATSGILQYSIWPTSDQIR